MVNKKINLAAVATVALSFSTAAYAKIDVRIGVEPTLLETIDKPKGALHELVQELCKRNNWNCSYKGIGKVGIFGEHDSIDLLVAPGAQRPSNSVQYVNTSSGSGNYSQMVVTLSKKHPLHSKIRSYADHPSGFKTYKLLAEASETTKLKIILVGDIIGQFPYWSPVLTRAAAKNGNVTFINTNSMAEASQLLAQGKGDLIINQQMDKPSDNFYKKYNLSKNEFDNINVHKLAGARFKANMKSPHYKEIQLGTAKVMSDLFFEGRLDEGDSVLRVNGEKVSPSFDRKLLPKTVQVAANMDGTDWSHTAKNGSKQVSGVSSVMIKEIFKELGINVDHKYYPSKRAAMNFKNGTIDLSVSTLNGPGQGGNIGTGNSDLPTNINGIAYMTGYSPLGAEFIEYAMDNGLIDDITKGTVAKVLKDRFGCDKYPVPTALERGYGWSEARMTARGLDPIYPGTFSSALKMTFFSKSSKLTMGPSLTLYSKVLLDDLAKKASASDKKYFDKLEKYRWILYGNTAMYYVNPNSKNLGGRKGAENLQKAINYVYWSKVRSGEWRDLHAWEGSLEVGKDIKMPDLN